MIDMAISPTKGSRPHHREMSSKGTVIEIKGITSHHRQEVRLRHVTRLVEDLLRHVTHLAEDLHRHVMHQVEDLLHRASPLIVEIHRCLEMSLLGIMVEIIIQETNKDFSVCMNHQGISVLHHPGSHLETLLL